MVERTMTFDDHFRDQISRGQPPLIALHNAAQAYAASMKPRDCAQYADETAAWSDDRDEQAIKNLSDIGELEAQAKVILEWCRQQKGLPEEQRDILELRRKPSGAWMPVDEPACNLALYECRLSKRPKTHKATVYWYRYAGGQVGPSLSTQQDHQWPGAVLLGTTTDEFTEPQE